MTRDILSVGAKLKAARLQRGLSVSAIAKETCMRKLCILALEKDDQAALPAKAFVIGFIRSYAKVVGLDGCELVTDYKATLDQKSAIIVPLQSLDRQKKSKPLLSRLVNIMTPAFSVLGLVVMWWGLSGSDLEKTDQLIAPPPQNLILLTKPMEPTHNEPLQKPVDDQTIDKNQVNAVDAGQ